MGVNRLMKPMLTASICLVMTAMATLAAEPRDLTVLRERYDSQARKALEPVLQNYVRDLEKLLVRTTQLREFDAADLVRAELGRAKAKQKELDAKPFLPPPVAGSKAAGNLLKNPGFEDGSADGWILWGQDPKRSRVQRSEKEAHEGHCSLLFRRAEGGTLGGVVQDLTGRVQPGDRVNLSLWVRRPADAGGEVGVGVALKDATGQRVIQSFSRPAPATGKWEKVILDFAVPTRDQTPDLGQIHLSVLSQGAVDPGEVWLDDAWAGKLFAAE